MTLWKKILLGILFVAVAVGFGYLIFRYFFFPPPDNANNANGNINGVLPNVNMANRPVANANVNGNLNVNAGLPNINGVYVAPSEVASGGYTQASQVISQSAESVALAGNKKDVVYYDPITGEFRRISADGSSQTLLTQDKYPQAEKVDWSPGRDKAVLSFPDRSKIVYDFNQGKQYSLPKETNEFSFSPAGNQLAYKYQGANEGENWLAVSSPDGSGAKVVESLGDYADAVKVDWSPNNQIIASYAKGANANQQEIVFLGGNDENFPSVKVGGMNFQDTWSPAGDKILYSVSSQDTDYNPTLWLMDGTTGNLGGSQQDLGLNTWPSKCAFGSLEAIYCAVPSYMPSGSDLYPELADTVPDEFYRIDLRTGAKTLLAIPVNASGYGSFTADNVYLSADEELLFFTDKATGRLYKIRLK